MRAFGKFILSPVWVVFILAATASARELSLETGTILSCYGSEEQRLKTAPDAVKRTGDHELQIRWLHGISTFKDEPPFDEDLDGVEWTYCDHSSARKLYFIEKRDQGLFTGVLLNESTGKIFDAGSTRVVISPDGAQYFASRQPDGMDGEQWFIFNMEGITQWEGNSDFDRRYEASWNSKGYLQAKYSCVGNEPDAPWERVTLVPSGTNWIWLPAVDCSGK